MCIVQRSSQSTHALRRPAAVEAPARTADTALLEEADYFGLAGMREMLEEELSQLAEQSTTELASSQQQAKALQRVFSQRIVAVTAPQQPRLRSAHQPITIEHLFAAAAAIAADAANSHLMGDISPQCFSDADF